MKFLKNFETAPSIFEEEKELVKYSNLDWKNESVFHDENFIFVKNGDFVSVFDRVCNHNHGKLLSIGNQIICPMHNWELDPTTGHYKNINLRKNPIFQGPTKNLPPKLTVSHRRRKLENFTSKKRVKIRHLNHACVIVETEKIKFAIDPWVIGSAFSNGWWLKNPSPADSFSELNSCDFIYISHNHPDHLHPLSLDKINREMVLLTASFQSKSTIRYIKEMGFNNSIALGFEKKLVNQTDEIAITALKSGDFRDDSGLLVQIGEFVMLLGVDSNFLDFWRFPKNVSLYASSFASGASGYPLCFENKDEKEKIKIINRNKTSKKEIVRQALKKMRPFYYMPYAGFFEEKSARDDYIKKNNLKNEIKDYQKITTELNVKLLDVENENMFEFFGNDLVQTKALNVQKFKEKSPEQLIAEEYELIDDLPKDKISDYFLNSQFFKNLDLEILETDDSFQNISEQHCFSFFDSAQPSINSKPVRREGVNYLRIKVRKKELYKVISQGLPWEDLSIGFQCKIYREPDIYNADFWFHFTNIYVNDNVKRLSENHCLKCEVLLQRF